MKLRLSKKFPLLGPAAKLAHLRKAHLPQFKLDRFPRSASQHRALRGILKCFKSFDSGMRCYYSFCELRGSSPFPARERVVVEWAAIFNPGQNYSNYVGYLRKDCFFLEQPLSWDTPAVKNMVAALKLEAKGKFTPPTLFEALSWRRS